MTDIVTLYLPEDFTDENCPPPQASCEAFAIRMNNGVWRLRHPETQKELERALAPGDVIRFCAFRDYPTRQLTVETDGTWSLDAPVPDDATHFMIDGDADTLGVTINEIVKGWGDPCSALGPGTHTLWNYHWSEPFSMRFAPNGDTPRFVREAVQ